MQVHIEPIHHTTVNRLTCNVSGDILVVDAIAAPVLITVDFNMASSELKYEKHIFKSLEDVCEFMVCLCNSKSAHHDGVTTTSSGKQVNSEWFAYVIPSLLIMMG